MQEALYREYFKDLIEAPMPRLADLIGKVDLVLLNTHPVAHFPMANAPNSVEVGGMHLRTLDDEMHPVSDSE